MDNRFFNSESRKNHSELTLPRRVVAGPALVIFVIFLAYPFYPGKSVASFSLSRDRRADAAR